MTASLMTNLVNDIDIGSIQGNIGPKPILSNRSDQEESFKIPSPENQIQENQKCEKKDLPEGTSGIKSEASHNKESKDKSKIDKNPSKNALPDSSGQINPLASHLAPSADPGSDYPEPLKIDNSGNALLMSADLRLKGDDVPISNQKLPSLIEKIQASPVNQAGNGDQGKTDGMIIKLTEVNGKAASIQADMKPADKDLSLMDKSISDLSIKGDVNLKKGDEKKSSENSTPEGNLSSQSGSAGSFSLIQSDQSRESAPNQSFNILHKNEEVLNTPILSTHEIPSDEKQILQQLTGWLRSHRSNELQSIRLNLSPETLGTIQIDLSVQNQQVKADIVASSAQVKELLEKHQDLLRNGLADNGLKVDQFTVRLEGPVSYQAGGSMNLNNRFFQRENQPAGNFWIQNGPKATFTPILSADDVTGRVSSNVQGRISIYI